VLDNVQRRRFLVQPAREDAAIAVLRVARLLDVELDEGAGQLLRLPRCRRLAGAQAHDRVADAHRLAGPQRQVLEEAVALVEEAQDRDPLPHRRRPRHLGGDRLRDVDRARSAIAVRGALPAALAAAGKDEKGREAEQQRPPPRTHP
jgi:hypothetical protein